MDVESVRVQDVAGAADRPPPDPLEQCVLHVLGDQAGDVHLALRPLLGPPLARGARVLEGRNGDGVRLLSGLEMPTAMAFTDEGGLYIAEKRGTVRSLTHSLT